MHVFKQTAITQVVVMINDLNHHHSTHHFKTNTEVSTIILSNHCEGRQGLINQFSNVSVIFVAVTLSLFIVRAETKIKRELHHYESVGIQDNVI